MNIKLDINKDRIYRYGSIKAFRVIKSRTTRYCMYCQDEHNPDPDAHPWEARQIAVGKPCLYTVYWSSVCEKHIPAFQAQMREYLMLMLREIDSLQLPAPTDVKKVMGQEYI